MSLEAQAFIVFVVGMLVLMGIGMNMAFALLLTGAAMAWVMDFWDTQLLAQNMVAGVDSFPLLAVPFFILAGELMNSGGISRRIIEMAQTWVGHIRGGLGFVAIGAAVLMASMSGSALADTAALATILLPMMREHGYPMHRSAGLIASGGIIAPIIPPSMPFIIYGVTTNTSISALFISGIVPGLIMGAALVVAWRVVLRKMTLQSHPPRSARLGPRCLRCRARGVRSAHGVLPRLHHSPHDRPCNAEDRRRESRYPDRTPRPPDGADTLNRFMLKGAPVRTPVRAALQRFEEGHRGPQRGRRPMGLVDFREHARQEGRNAEAAVRYAFHSVGRALWITTAVLVIGFSVLMLSSFRLNSDLGLLTAIIILTALLIDFLFLPAFLLKFDNKDNQANA